MMYEYIYEYNENNLLYSIVTHLNFVNVACASESNLLLQHTLLEKVWMVQIEWSAWVTSGSGTHMLWNRAKYSPS